MLQIPQRFFLLLKPPPWNFQWSNSKGQLKCQHSNTNMNLFDWPTTPTPHTSMPNAGRNTSLWLKGNLWRTYMNTSFYKTGKLFGTHTTHVQRHVYSTPKESATWSKWSGKGYVFLILDNSYININLFLFQISLTKIFRTY